MPVSTANPNGSKQTKLLPIVRSKSEALKNDAVESLREQLGPLTRELGMGGFESIATEMAGRRSAMHGQCAAVEGLEVTDDASERTLTGRAIVM